MKVLFDHQLFSYQRIGGASKYFCELLYHMPKDMWETTTVFSNNQYVHDLKLFDSKHLLPNHYFKGQGRIMNELNKPHSIRILKRQEFDVFHQTHFEPYCITPLGNKPMVTTFHDINFSTLSPNPKIVKQQEISLKRADHIIAVSENTKKDMINLFNIDEKKVSVIYHGIEFVDLETIDSEKIFNFPYILYVGTRRNHKNWDKFIKSFALVSQKFPEIKLVCTGKQFTNEEINYLKELNLSDKVFLITATEYEIIKLYRDCLLFIFPSLYEGFGMPLLEAMAYKAPVLCSKASCFPEIASDAAEYFNPDSIDDMYSSMVKVIDDEEYRDLLVKKGSVRVKDFSWDICAEKHIEIYKSLI